MICRRAPLLGPWGSLSRLPRPVVVGQTPSAPGFAAVTGPSKAISTEGERVRTSVSDIHRLETLTVLGQNSLRMIVVTCTSRKGATGCGGPRISALRVAGHSAAGGRIPATRKCICEPIRALGRPTDA